MSGAGTVESRSTASRVSDVLLREVEAFVYLEGGLQDRHEYDAWEALWTDDGVYWIRQLHTGRRLAQTPKSNLVRVISNIEIASESGEEINVRANAIIFESAPRRDTLWGTRYEYTLRRIDGALKMARKKVVLVNNDKALPNMAFLI